MKRLLLLLFVLLRAPLCDAINLWAPKATNAPAATEAALGAHFTAAPLPAHELARRDSTITLGSVLFAPGSICALANGQSSYDSSIGCYGNYPQCVISLVSTIANPFIACCLDTEAQICAQPYTRCIASSDLEASCDNVCSSNTQIVKCSYEAQAFCQTGDVAGLGAVNVYCDAAPGTVSLSLVAGYSTSLLLTTITATSTSISSSSPPSTSKPSPPPSSSTSSSPPPSSSKPSPPPSSSTSSSPPTSSIQVISSTSSASSSQTITSSKQTTDPTSSILSIIQTGVPITAQQDPAAACFLNSAYTAYYSTPSWWSSLPPDAQSFLASVNAGNTAACKTIVSQTSGSTTYSTVSFLGIKITPVLSASVSSPPSTTSFTSFASSSEANTTTADSSGLNSGQKTGIGVGVGVGGAAVAAGIILILVKAGTFTGIFGGGAAATTGTGGVAGGAGGAGTAGTAGTGGAANTANVTHITQPMWTGAMGHDPSGGAWTGVMGDPSGGGWSGVMGGQVGTAGAGAGATPAAPAGFGAASTVPAAPASFGASTIPTAPAAAFGASVPAAPGFGGAMGAVNPGWGMTGAGVSVGIAGAAGAAGAAAGFRRMGSNERNEPSYTARMTSPDSAELDARYSGIPSPAASEVDNRYRYQ